ncbi:hypothetical protein B7463_g10460, partial [Scytalidium lignicola]
MRFQSSSLLVAGLTALSVSAEPIHRERQADESGNVSQFVNDIVAYATSLAANPTYASVLMALETDEPAIFSSLSQYEQSAVANPVAITAVPDFFTVIPSKYQDIFRSVYSAEISIAIKDGLLTAAPTIASGNSGPTSSPAKPNTTSSGSQQTGAASGSGSDSSSSSAASPASPSGSSTNTASGSTATPNAGNLRSENSVVTIAGGVLAGVLGAVLML